MHGYVCVSVCACCVCVLVHVCDGSIERVAVQSKVLLLRFIKNAWLALTPYY